jgi:hypothetical protein
VGEGGGGGCPADITRRRHRGETVEDEKKDTAPDILLKHSNTTLATYSELKKDKTLKTCI